MIWERHCCGCGEPIVECMGFVKVGDIMEAETGKRKWTDVRELCQICADFNTWTAEGKLALCSPEYMAERFPGVPT